MTLCESCAMLRDPSDPRAELMEQAYQAIARHVRDLEALRLQLAEERERRIADEHTRDRLVERFGAIEARVDQVIVMLGANP